MKKTIVILTALVALVACSKEAPVVEDSTQKENQEIKVNFNISRSDITDATKARVKTDWATNDVVFVFFANVDNPSATKYLELKKNKSTWVANLHGLTASDFKEDGKITAIYLPYGSDYTVAYAGGSFTIKSASDTDYSGHFYISEKADYDFVESTLTGTISLIAATPVDARDKLIHFDVTGYTSGHEYDMYQDYMKPISLTSIALDGTVSKSVGSKGDAIPGYEDATFVSFSGVLDYTAAVGKEKDYQFSINDITTSVLYTRDAGDKTVSANKYIGLGTLSNTTTWNANEYVDLGCSTTLGKRVMWAKKNLGATVERGEGSYGKFYALGEVDGYPLSGTYGNYTCEHRFHDVPTYELDKSHEYLWNLKPEYDAAHAELKGLWRIPTSGDMPTTDMYSLLHDTTREVDGEGVNAGFIVRGKGAYSSASIFLPLAGYVTEYLPEYQGIKGDYWFSTVCFSYNGGWQHKENKFIYLYFSSDSPSSGYCDLVQGEEDPQWGQTIRPVFSIK